MSDRSGFTLVEVLMLIALISILAITSISVLDISSTSGRFDNTLLKMQEIRRALVGDPYLRQGANLRSQFGYLGDVGALPTNAQGIAALSSQPAGVSAWAANVAARIGLGWNGPYLSTGDSGSDYSTDAWGTAFVYDATATPPTLISRGADGVAGGVGLNQDITVQIPVNMRSSTVYGFILSGGAQWSGDAQVEINYPDGSGALAQSLTNVVPADNGLFSFANIPLGVRSATIYVPTKASPAKTVGPFTFTVDKSFYVIPTSLTSISCAYPLDTVAAPAVAYSLRKLKTAYAGALIRVRRASDNAEQDINPDATGCGMLDTAALLTFVGASSGYVTTWYDQSGNARDATQATAGSQPQIVNAGAVETKFGQPIVLFDGSTFISGVALGIASTSNWSYSILQGSTTTVDGVDTNSAGTYYLDRTSTTNNLTSLKAVAGKYCLQKRNDAGANIGCISSTTNISTTAIQSVYAERVYNTTFKVFLDNTNEGTLAETDGALTPPAPNIGRHTTSTTASDFGIYEFIYWGSDLSSSDRTTLYNGQRTEFNF